MSSYTTWDRTAYIERVGGEEEAERRRMALMARQHGDLLVDEPQASDTHHKSDPLP